MVLTRRDLIVRLLPGAVAVPALGSLAACSATAGQSGAGESPTAVGSSAAAEPAVITHKFGQTTVPPGAQRVACVGWNDQDFVLPFGIVPLGSRSWFENYDDFPWVQQATGGKGVPVFDGEEINFEAVAAAAPDVIFAIYESIDKQEYAKLSAIAPTVIQSSDHPDEETPWDVQLITTGTALGRADKAKELVADVQAKIDAAKSEHPEFAGKVLVMDYGPENGGHWLIGKGDPRRSLFDALGFATQDHEGDLSEEKLNEIDHDVLFVVGATKEQMTKSKVFAGLDVVKEDRALYTTFESTLAGALSYSGPQALLYALDKPVPQLANALNGRPVEDLANA